MTVTLFIKQIEVGPMQNFSYLIGDPATKDCASIDPAWEVDRVLKIARRDGYRVTRVLLTHNHFDHIGGVEEVVRATGAKVYIHPLDAGAVQKMGEVISVSAGEKIPLGKLSVTVLHTPGHTAGSICYLVQAPGDPLQHLFTGDTLFQGNCGRCDLPESDPKALFKSLMTLRDLDPATKVYPGHDYGATPVTTIGYEREHNPAMQARFFGEFQEIP